MRRIRLVFGCAVCVLTAMDVQGARAQPTADVAASDGTRGYALVVGANVGGAGQHPLRFAEEDAGRFANALVELGRFGQERVTLLAGPTRQQALSALNEIDAAARHDADAGRDAVVVVYYSGHARAQALNLGTELLALSDLRERIFAMAGTLKLVVLDACQSGAFSRPKGAQPTADFSYNSVEQLRTAGVAVIASSSATELSQESEALGASYFTHHMLVAMRGGGDANHDGRVTLAETYQYAYDRTLLATAETAIGGQHVTLETSLQGQGDVALSYPARADAQLVLAANLEADLVVSHVPSRSVVAEVHKVAGAEMQLALPAGRYSAIVRHGTTSLRCAIMVTATHATVLATDACEVVADSVAATKGGDEVRPRETWALQIGVGAGSHHNNAYVETLQKFGYGENGNVAGRFQLAGSHLITPHLAVGGQFLVLDARRFVRRTLEFDQHFEWRSYAFGPYVRLQAPWRLIVPYVDIGVGISFAATTLDEAVAVDPTFEPAPGSDDQPELTTLPRDQWKWGAHVAIAAGVQWMPWEHFGFFTQLGWVLAPTVSNRIGDTHDVGGLTWLLGVRLRGMETP